MSISLSVIARAPYSLSGRTENYKLTDRVLVEGVKIHCPHLRSLSLHSLSRIQSAGLQDLFTSWVNTGITHLNLHRVSLLENEAIDALITHSGHSLIELDLNSVDELEETVLKRLASECKELRVVDLSFIRSCDDFVLGVMMKEMKELKTVFVHGNNRVTDGFPARVSDCHLISFLEYGTDLLRCNDRLECLCEVRRIVKMSNCRDSPPSSLFL